MPGISDGAASGCTHRWLRVYIFHLANRGEKYRRQIINNVVNRKESFTQKGYIDLKINSRNMFLEENY